MSPWWIVDGVLVLYVLVAGFLIRRTLRLRGEVGAAASWSWAASRVIESTLAEHFSSKGGRTMWPVVVYEYEVDGRARRGQRATFGEVVAYDLEGRARRRLAALVASAGVRASYDPRDPAVSVIERSAPVLRRDWVLLGIVLVVLAGVVWVRRTLA